MYSRGRQLKPDDFMLLFQYGCTLQELGEWGQAIEVLENTLKLKPQYARALCTLAICQARTGNKPAAADSFLRAVNIEKDNSLILAQYGYFLEDEGEYRITSYNVCYTKLLRCEFKFRSVNHSVLLI